MSARALIGLLVAIVAAAVAPAAAQAACPAKLPVRVALPDGPFAAAYTKQIRVTVDPAGRNLWNLRADLYTFSGQRFASSRVRRVASRATTVSLRLDRAFRPMQPGGFTLVLTADPGGSCGDRKATRVLRFKPCAETLPVTFASPPGGSAADYGDFLSVPVSSGGGVIRDVTSVVYGFDGSLLGRAPKLGALFGDRSLDHRLLRPLTPGQYTVVVEGLAAEQPAACGRKRAQATMTFG